MSASSEFPVSRRATSPIALEMFAMVRSGTVADMACVVAAIEDERGRRSTPRARLLTERQDRSLQAIRAYQAANDGILPSRRQYDAWYDGDADKPRDVVRSGVIRSAFGGWSAAIGAAGGQGTPAALAYQRTARGPRATRKGAIALIQTCAQELGTDRLTFFGHYRPWALQEALRDPARFELVIISPPTFHNLFDRSWAKALSAAGLAPEDADPAVALPMSRNGRRRGPSDAYSDQNLLDAVRAAGADAEHRLTCDSYSAWRAALLAHAEADGTVKFIPSSRVLMLRFTTWRDVLDRAGLLSDEERSRWVSRGGPRYTTATIATALQEAAIVLGPDVRTNAYARWRQQQLRKQPARRLPSADTVARVFGTFAAARRHALAVSAGGEDTR